MAAAHAAALTLATGLQPVTHAQWIQGMGIRLDNGDFQSTKDIKVMEGPLASAATGVASSSTGAGGGGGGGVGSGNGPPKMMAFRGKGRPRNDEAKMAGGGAGGNGGNHPGAGGAGSQCYSSLPGICGETVTLQLLGSPDGGDPNKKPPQQQQQPHHHQQQPHMMKENENHAPSSGGMDGQQQQQQQPGCNHHVTGGGGEMADVTPSPSDSLHSVGNKQMVSMSDMSPIPSESGHVHIHGDHSKHMVPMHPVACPECSKMFTNKGLLTQHMLVHTNKVSRSYMRGRKLFHMIFEVFEENDSEVLIFHSFTEKDFESLMLMLFIDLYANYFPLSLLSFGPLPLFWRSPPKAKTCLFIL